MDVKIEKIAHCFDDLHDRLAYLRYRVQELDDPAAESFVELMETGLLAPMRRLRIHLDIPYWKPGADASKRGERE